MIDDMDHAAGRRRPLEASSPIGPNVASTKPITVAIIWQRLGPYHCARLNAVGVWARTVAIELTSRDQTYAWDEVRHAGAFERETLFTDGPIEHHSRQTLAVRLRGILNEIRPHVVVVPGWDEPAALMALAWALESGTPTVVMSDSQAHDARRTWWKEAVKGRIVRLHGAGFVAGGTHASYLVALGMPPAQIARGLDVVDNAYFGAGAEAESRDKSKNRERLGLPKHFFMSSARFVAKKNLPALVRAYARYRRRVGQAAWDLVLLGDGPLRPELERIRAELGLSHVLHMPGFKQYAELPAFYGLAGAFVLASVSEQWGLVVNEAMASGLPVLVSSRCGCAPELVEEGRNGFVLDPVDEEGMAACLERVAGDSCDRAAMGAASRDIVAQWGLARFDIGLREASEIAIRAPRPRPSIIDRAILHGLVRLRR